jgi:hypothetical protein
MHRNKTDTIYDARQLFEQQARHRNSNKQARNQQKFEHPGVRIIAVTTNHCSKQTPDLHTHKIIAEALKLSCV